MDRGLRSVSAELLFLSAADVRACAPSPGEMLHLVEEVFRAHGQQRARHEKMHLDLRATHGGHFAAFPAYVDPGSPQEPIVGVKWLANFVDNPGRFGLPAVTALIVINDLARGVPLAILEGGYITALRTAAASAVGARYLAQTPVETIAIIGASAQGREHLMALHHAFRPRQVRVFDVRHEVAHRFVQDFAHHLDLDVTASETCIQAVHGADVVVLATSAREPFFEGDWCQPGMLLIAISGVQDLKAEVLRRVDRLIVDVLSGEEAPGALGLRPFFARGILSPDDVDATMADIVNGRAAGREGTGQIILYSPGGLGTEDVATAHLVYQCARREGVGTWLTLL